MYIILYALQKVVWWKYKGRENGKYKYPKLHLCAGLECTQLSSITDYSSTIIKIKTSYFSHHCINLTTVAALLML